MTQGIVRVGLQQGPHGSSSENDRKCGRGDMMASAECEATPARRRRTQGQMLPGKTGQHGPTRNTDYVIHPTIQTRSARLVVGEQPRYEWLSTQYSVLDGPLWLSHKELFPIDEVDPSNLQDNHGAPENGRNEQQ